MKAIALALAITGCIDQSPPTTVEECRGTCDEPPRPLRIFITATSYAADFATTANGDALVAADGFCATAAESVFMPGNWKAWLSTSTVDAIERIGSNGPWVTMNGTRVFNNHANLETLPMSSFAQNERGQFVDREGSAIWTGTSVRGVRTAHTCNDWTRTIGMATYGSALETDHAWTEEGVADCVAKARFLCLETR